MTSGPDAAGPARGSGSTVLADMRRSPFAKLRPVPIEAVRLGEGFWLDRLRANAEASLRAGLGMLGQAGAIDNFLVAAGRRPRPSRGPVYHDSDLYKWLEAAGYVLAWREDAGLEAEVDALTARIAGAQEADGYLNTHYATHPEKRRFGDLVRDHELYCAGHLVQAAIALRRATGKTALLDVATRFADLACATFGPGGRPGAPGHPGIEMALVELYRETGRARYLDLAAAFIDARGARPPVAGGGPYTQDHVPFRAQREAVGHAVRAMYLYAGAADLYAERGDPTLREALQALWRDVVDRKRYVTGGVGARHEGEAFGAAYELPNASAYAETCAAIGLALWSWRMLQIEGESGCADRLEGALYNGILAGVALDGTRFFYVNPLESDGGTERQPWFPCACCPPNIMRMLAGLPGLMASLDDEGGVHLHLYAQADLRLRASGGRTVGLAIRTRYPWEGDVRIRVEETPGESFAIRLRIPSWCPGAAIEVGGRPVSPSPRPGTYAALRRPWKPGDEIRIDLDMPVEVLASDPRVRANRGCVALRRGPIVYCFEGHDQPGVDLGGLRLVLDPASPHEGFRAAWRDDLLGGLVALHGRGRAPARGREGTLYRPLAPEDLALREVPLVAIPYHAWANRGPNPMRVWTPVADGPCPIC